MRSYYNVRDMLGHFVKPKSERGELCPHKCCGGRRPHPAAEPLIPNKKLLRALTDEQWYAHAQRIDWRDQRQVQEYIAEGERRERRDAAARRRATSAADRRRNEAIDFEIEIEAKYLQAEHATRGDLLNKAGKAARIDPRSLFYGQEARARKYASEELSEWFTRNGRLTRTEFQRGRRRSRATR
jgi:hypothetical protein